MAVFFIQCYGWYEIDDCWLEARDILWPWQQTITGMYYGLLWYISMTQTSWDASPPHDHKASQALRSGSRLRLWDQGKPKWDMIIQRQVDKSWHADLVNQIPADDMTSLWIPGHFNSENQVRMVSSKIQPVEDHQPIFHRQRLGIVGFWNHHAVKSRPKAQTPQPSSPRDVSSPSWTQLVSWARGSAGTAAARGSGCDRGWAPRVFFKPWVQFNCWKMGKLMKICSSGPESLVVLGDKSLSYRPKAMGATQTSWTKREHPRAKKAKIEIGSPGKCVNGHVHIGNDDEPWNKMGIWWPCKAQ